MLTPDQLNAMPKPLMQTMRGLEEDILNDICRRMKGSETASETALHQIRMLQEQGLDMAHIEKRIQNTLGISRTQLDGLFDDALQRNQKFNKRLLDKLGLTQPERSASMVLGPEIEAIRRQTHGEFQNITRSLGFAVRENGNVVRFYRISEAYQRILDKAALGVSTGMMDYNTAIRKAVTELTASGVRCVHYYRDGKIFTNQVDVAARRAIMTGVTQLTARYAEQTAEELGTDLVEVTAHAGARDTGTGFLNHKDWQGKVYSLSGKSREYPNLVEVCGYGNVGGLCGANCRHSFFPFVEGASERVYTDQQLRNIDPKPFTYQGKRYNAYEATQQQRKLETAIRAQKRLVLGLKASGLINDASAASVKLRRLQSVYEDFSRSASLPLQMERMRI